ncbi:MAG: WD40 repeat domain-containing protein [Candidatus Heimdallarchaeota archaeon]
MTEKKEEVKIWPHMGIETETYPLSVAFHPDGNLIAVGTREKTVKITDIKQLKTIQLMQQEYAIHAVEWSPNGEYLAVGSLDGPLKIIQTSDWSVYKELDKESEALTISWSSNGKFLVVGSNRFFSRDFIDLWDTSTWTKIKADVKLPYMASFSSDSEFLAITYETFGIEVLTTKDFSRVKLLEFSTSDMIANIASPVWSPDGAFLAACNDEGYVQIWNTSTWEIIFSEKLLGVWDEGRYRAAFSPDNKFLAIGGVSNPKLLSTKDWQVIAVFKDVYTEDVLDFSWHPNSKYLAIADQHEHEVNIFEIELK